MFSKSTSRMAAVLASLALSLSSQAQTIYALTGTNTLATINASSPATTTMGLPITGVAAGQRIVGLDSRPATGELYALAYNTGTSEARLYVINKTTALATAVGAAAIALNLGNGSGIGFDFNPTVDRIRVTSRSGSNYRLNPITGGIAATDLNLQYSATDPLAGGVPRVASVAYTNNFIGAGSTQLYALDDSLGAIYIVNPPNAGVLNTQGMRSTDVAGITDIDILSTSAGINTAYVTSMSGNNAQLQTLTLATGALTQVGQIGVGMFIADIAVDITLAPLLPLQGRLAYGLTPGNALVSWDAANPSRIRSQTLVSGIAMGQVIVGMDIRPVDRMPYVLGYNSANNNAQVYMLNPATGVATSMGAIIQLELGSGTNVGFDFNPTVDRIRVVSTNNANYRLNPATGAIATTDLALNFASGDVNALANPAVGAAAYTNSFAGATSTRLFVYDDSLNILALQSPPNNGTLNTKGGPPISFATLDGGVDLDIAYNAADGSNVTYAVGRPNSGSVSNFYMVDTATGGFTLVGAIGSGTTIRDFALSLDSAAITSTRNLSLEENIRVYPNPSNGTELYLSALQGNANGYSVDLISQTGQALRLKTIAKGDRVGVQVGTLAPGLYSLRITKDGSYVGTTRFTKL